MNRFELAEKLKEKLGAENLLDQLVKSLGEDTAYEHFEYIARMNDIKEEVFNENDQEAQLEIAKAELKKLEKDLNGKPFEQTYKKYKSQACGEQENENGVFDQTDILFDNVGITLNRMKDNTGMICYAWALGEVNTELKCSGKIYQNNLSKKEGR